MPPEIVFDQDIGDLFVVRVAGNVAGPDEIASIEYALEQWDWALVFLVGLTQFGSLAAVLDPLPPGFQPPDIAGAPYLGSLLVSVRSNVSLGSSGGGLRPAKAAGEPDRWRQGVEANVRQTMQGLGTRSQIVRARVSRGALVIAGLVYDVKTGCVEVLPPG